MLHQSRQSPIPNTNQNFEVRFFEGEWIKKSDREPENIASREEIMMALEDVDNILIKLQYNEGVLNTSLTNIEMDSAAAPNSGLGAASFVEECICPVGYAGYSCEVKMIIFIGLHSNNYNMITCNKVLKCKCITDSNFNRNSVIWYVIEMC